MCESVNDPGNNPNIVPAGAFETIRNDWTRFALMLNAKTFVLGVSGGKDSTVVAYLAAKIFGPENVIGVLMPNGKQYDIDDAREVCKLTGIKCIEVNIGNTYNNLMNEIVDQLDHINDDTTKQLNINYTDTIINMPPRLRMTAVYGVAQAVNGIVLNTSNLTEDVLGYATLWGDTCGSYAPIQGLTVTEVIELGEWLGIPDKLIHKVPADGLQNSTDEERLGMKYADVDRFIRYDEGTDDFKAKVLQKYRVNKFKTEMIHLPGPKFKEYANHLNIWWMNIMSKAKTNVSTLELKKQLADSLKKINSSVENINGVGASDISTSVEKLDENIIRENIRLEALQDNTQTVINNSADAEAYLKSIQ